MPSTDAQGKSSVYFDIKVTEETNTKAEKAQYIAEAFTAFAELLGNLHEESYIYVQDVRAAAYGYGGRSFFRRGRCSSTPEMSATPYSTEITPMKYMPMSSNPSE